MTSQMGLLTLLRMISGARYSGVPHNVHVLPLTRLAKPKSVTYTIEIFKGEREKMIEKGHQIERKFGLNW